MSPIDYSRYPKNWKSISQEVRARSGNTKHGHRGSKYTSPTWSSWRAMVERCTTPSGGGFERYGGRGINVCMRWRNSFSAFFEDMGERPTGKTIDRINNEGNYEPSNCRWASKRVQARNKRSNFILTYLGKTQCLAAWAEETGIDRTTIRWRIKKKWPIEKTLNSRPMSREERGILGLISRGVI